MKRKTAGTGLPVPANLFSCFINAKGQIAWILTNAVVLDNSGEVSSATFLGSETYLYDDSFVG